MKHWAIAIVAAGLLMSAAGALAQDATPSAEISPEDFCMMRRAEYDPQTGACAASASIEVHVDYPTEVLAWPQVRAAVDALSQRSLADFVQAVADNMAVDLPYFAPMQYELRYSAMEWRGWRTLLFTLYTFTGGAHGMTTSHSMVYSADSGAILALEDLFTPETDILALLQPPVREALEAQIGEMALPDFIEPGIGSLDSFRTFTLSSEGVTFVFDPYAVAPYAAGTQQVLVPWSALAPALAAPFATGG